MFKIDEVSTEGLTVKRTTDNSIEIWDNDHLMISIVSPEFGAFIDFLKDAQKILGLEPKSPSPQEIPKGYYPGGGTITPSKYPWSTGTMPNTMLFRGGTCNNGNT